MIVNSLLQQLTCGSLRYIGSASGVPLMGSARGIYTFAAHLQWTWVVGLGYAAGIVAHLPMNAKNFSHLEQPGLKMGKSSVVLRQDMPTGRNSPLALWLYKGKVWAYAKLP